MTLICVSKLRQWLENGPSPSSAFAFSAECCFLDGAGCSGVGVEVPTVGVWLVLPTPELCESYIPKIQVKTLIWYTDINNQNNFLLSLYKFALSAYSTQN